MEECVRSPIVCVLGHVDVGKTLLLDKIRGTATMFREVGAMFRLNIWRMVNPTYRSLLPTLESARENLWSSIEDA